MDNISYHGTKNESANQIVGPPINIQVSRGRGELGAGFYTGSSIALASIWARTKHGSNGAVIEIDIPKPAFVQLNGRVIKTTDDVVSKWNELRNDKTTTTFLFKTDYIIAPFALLENTGHQLKFESQKAEDTLNNSKAVIYPCGS